MEVREIQNKKIWEDFLLGCEEKTFLQSWNWGKFQERMGNKIWRLGIYNRGELFSAVLVSKISAKRGTFLLIQHGPNTKTSNFRASAGRSEGEEKTHLFALQLPISKHEILKTLLEKIKEIAKKENCIFIRMVPLWERNKENEEIFKRLGFRLAPMHANAYEATLKLDLSASEEEILRKMRKTTRYLIRQAQKNYDFEILKSDKIEDLDIYNELNQEVARHQKFAPFSFKFIENEFSVLAEDNQVLLFFGKYSPPDQKFGSGGEESKISSSPFAVAREGKEKIIAAALVVFWSGIGFYHQAALSPKYHKIPIAYILQWEAIKEAKKRGCLLYDFWGYVNPKENPNHPWAGPTLFKMSFGGKPYEYVKTQDFPLSKKYWLTFIFEKIRKIKRGL